MRLRQAEGLEGHGHGPDGRRRPDQAREGTGCAVCTRAGAVLRASALDGLPTKSETEDWGVEGERKEK